MKNSAPISSIRPVETAWGFSTRGFSRRLFLLPSGERGNWLRPDGGGAWNWREKVALHGPHPQLEWNHNIFNWHFPKFPTWKLTKEKCVENIFSLGGWVVWLLWMRGAYLGYYANEMCYNEFTNEWTRGNCDLLLYITLDAFVTFCSTTHHYLFFLILYELNFWRIESIEMQLVPLWSAWNRRLPNLHTHLHIKRFLGLVCVNSIGIVLELMADL